MNVSTDERLSAYLDGELTDDEVADLEAELQRSASLRGELAALQSVVRLLGEEGPVRAPLGFHAAVMERVEAEHPQATWASWWRRPFGVPLQGWGVALAAAAVLLVVARPSADGPIDGPQWRETEDLPVEGDPSPAAVKLRSLEEAKDEPSTAPVVKGEPVAPAPTPVKSTQPVVEAPPKPEPPAPEAVEPVPVLRTLPAGYTLYTEDPASLRSVLSLVGKLGGSITTPEGAPITVGTLEHAEQAVIIRLPSGAFSEFQAALGKMGRAEASFDSEALFARPEIDLQLTFKLVGGSQGTADDAASKAARKAYREADAINEGQ